MSDVIEDEPDVCPSLLAHIFTHDGLDSKMRLSVYYSSNVTGKEVVLASATFTERELLRAMTIAGELQTDVSVFLLLFVVLCSWLNLSFSAIIDYSDGL